MAYITTEKVAQIRAKIKEEFPAKKGWKFSIQREDHSCINISIITSPVRFHEKDHTTLNAHYLEKYQHADILERIKEIANEGNYDNSDSMTDYFDVGWYCSLNQGTWDKPFECTTECKVGA